MIHIGNQTSFAAPPLVPFEYALAAGFDAFEWFPDRHGEAAGWDEADLAAPLRARIRERARAAGVRMSVHARWQANPLQAECRAWLWKDLELARDLGAELLNIHLYAEQGAPAFVEAILPLVRRAAAAGICLAIENTPQHSPELFNELFELLRAPHSAPAAQVGMCLDVGHANLCEATHNRYLEFLDRLDPRLPIIHLHLHENWGDADSHLPLFTGPAARDESGVRHLLERLARRNFSGSIILEQWPHPPSLLNAARDRLLQLFDEAASAAQASPSRASPAPGGPLTPALSPSDGEREEPGAGREIPESIGLSERRPTLLPLPVGRGEGRGEGASAGQGEPDFVGELAAADRRCRSWREKLDWVRERLARKPAPLSKEQLVDVAIYLRFLGTGQVRCAEDGRHFRPAHHARIALDIQRRLARLPTAEQALIARKIHPWLPSTAQPFQRAEPLTRIRDIAHRNDIPSELKREIKESLQNKLHRCAGPEDLVTATALLDRITAPGANYSPDFVEQFKIFHHELREFFNAHSLDERLEALLDKAGADGAALIRSFLSQKAGAGLSGQLGALRALSGVRRLCLDRTRREPGQETEPFLLADIALEDFAFSLLSRMINALEGGGGEQMRLWLETLLLTVANLALSSVEPEECAAIESELRAWGPDLDRTCPKSPASSRPLSQPLSKPLSDWPFFDKGTDKGCDKGPEPELLGQALDSGQSEPLLRLKATMDRSLRLAQEQSRRIAALFSTEAERLGCALGVAEHAIRVFAEAEIRGHLVFQLSRLAAALLRRLRARLQLPPWDVLVSGRATGRLRAVRRLEDSGQPVLALLDHAEGDEEIPANVRGIVLAHDLPHLSHLGVRARQGGVVLVCCEEAAEWARLKDLQGQVITLTATAEKVEWAAAECPASSQAGRQPARIPPARLAPKPPCVALEQLVPGSGGGKAAGARRLEELARQPGAGFKTSPGLVVPLGVMEQGLHAAPQAEAEYHQLCRDLDRMPAQEFAAATGRLREIIGRIDVPQGVAIEVGRRFRPRDRLMVRSSANCEDLPDMAGAGLYESIANVPPAQVASAVRAVWASLWTQRAASSRKQGGVPHDQVRMAVLIQLLLDPDFSFVLHTVNPLDGNSREVYAELAVGLGQTLVSGAMPGNPYRLVCNKHSGQVRTLAFANFSQALRTGQEGRGARGEGRETRGEGRGTRDEGRRSLPSTLDPRPSGVWRQTVDYSRVSLSCDTEARRDLGGRLAVIARRVEEAFGAPQDVEGAVLARDIYLVQARAQQGLRH